MNTPNISPYHDYYDYWEPVEAGEVEPDEWQSALMSLTQQALDEGLFYNRDVDAWIKAHNDFIPVEWWSYQYLPPHHEVEGGIMGMELYMARCSIRAKKEREADAEAIKALSVGQVVGTLSVNSKKTPKCVIKAIQGNTVVFTCVRGRYGASFETSARHVPHMIEEAIKRGWRKP